MREGGTRRLGARDRRLAALFGLSAAGHMALLGGFAFTTATAPFPAVSETHDVVLVAPFPVIRPAPARTASAAAAPQVIVADAAPRMSARAAAGETAPASVDLFGPVFSDGLWPRPLLVGALPCETDDDVRPEDVEVCRRELRLIGLASDAVAGANAPP